MFRERTIIGSVSYRYLPILGVSYGIVLATVVWADIRASMQVHQLLTGSKGVQATRHPPAAHARVRAVLWPRYGRGLGEGRRKETVT